MDTNLRKGDHLGFVRELAGITMLARGCQSTVRSPTACYSIQKNFSKNTKKPLTNSVSQAIILKRLDD